MTTLRRARPGDLEAFTAFVAGLSPTTSYRRFFTGVSHLPTAYATRLLRSGATSGAWLAWVGDVVVGHGFWAAVGPDTAELALVVADRAQGRGVGRALTTAALGDATAAGMRQLELVVAAGQPSGRRPRGPPMAPPPYRGARRSARHAGDPPTGT